MNTEKAILAALDVEFEVFFARYVEAMFSDKHRGPTPLERSIAQMAWTHGMLRGLQVERNERMELLQRAVLEGSKS